MQGFISEILEAKVGIDVKSKVRIGPKRDRMFGPSISKRSSDVNDLGCEYRGSEVPVEADAELKPWE